MKERKHLQQTVLGKLDVYMQKNEIRPILSTHTKTSHKWNKDLAVKPETLKLLEGNRDSALYDTGTGKDIMKRTPFA